MMLGDASALTLFVCLNQISSAYGIHAPSRHEQLSGLSQQDHFRGQDVIGNHELVRKHFHWKVYADYNADLPEEIRSSRKSSWEHYVQHGLGESRLAVPLRIVLKYSVQQGFSNQVYCHISALTLAARLKAEVILAPSQMRSSFEHYELQTGTGWQPTEWTIVPLNHIIDVQKLRTFWDHEGMMLHEVRCTSAKCCKAFVDQMASNHQELTSLSCASCRTAATLFVRP